MPRVTIGPLAWAIEGLGAGMGRRAVCDHCISTTEDLDGTACQLCLGPHDVASIWKKKLGPGENPGFIFQPDCPQAPPTINGESGVCVLQYLRFTTAVCVP